MVLFFRPSRGLAACFLFALLLMGAGVPNARAELLPLPKSNVPSECDSFCSTRGGAAHAICIAAAQKEKDGGEIGNADPITDGLEIRASKDPETMPVKEKNGGEIGKADPITDGLEIRASSKLPPACQTFCSSRKGMGHELCAAVDSKPDPLVSSPPNGPKFPGVCNIYCSFSVAASHPICKALAFQNGPLVEETPTGAILIEDGGVSVAGTGLPKPCETFCSSRVGMGNALCAQAQQIAALNRNVGGSGLMVNGNYGRNVASSGDPNSIAARMSIEQQEQARALGARVTLTTKAAIQRQQQALQAKAIEEVRRMQSQARGQAREQTRGRSNSARW